MITHVLITCVYMHINPKYIYICINISRINKL